MGVSHLPKKMTIIQQNNMTVIKSKIIKEVITNIKQEQQELNNLQRLEN
jgi:hypothetical protein